MTTRHHDTPKGDTRRDSVTVTEAARLLGVSVRTVQRRLDSGDLRAIERDGKRFVDMTPDATSDATQGDSLTRQTATRDTTAPELLNQLRDENTFLRAQVDAWRLQAEAANRTAAETSAALRKALDAMPKAITGGGNLGQVGTENTSRENAPQAPISATGDQTPAASTPIAQRGGKRPKLTAWQRVAARILGIRS